MRRATSEGRHIPPVGFDRGATSATAVYRRHPRPRPFLPPLLPPRLLLLPLLLVLLLRLSMRRLLSRRPQACPPAPAAPSTSSASRGHGVRDTAAIVKAYITAVCQAPREVLHHSVYPLFIGRDGGCSHGSVGAVIGGIGTRACGRVHARVESYLALVASVQQGPIHVSSRGTTPGGMAERGTRFTQFAGLSAKASCCSPQSTVGGDICHGSPAASMTSPFIAKRSRLSL